MRSYILIFSFLLITLSKLSGQDINFSSEYNHIKWPINPNYPYGGGITGDDGVFKRLTLYHGHSIALETGSNTKSHSYTRMYINSTGLVGFSTTTPLEKLHVKNGGTLIEMDSRFGTEPRILFQNDGDGANPYQTFYRWTGNSNTYFATRFYHSGNQGFKIQVDNSTVAYGEHTFKDVMIIQRSGKVGIGTTTPDELLTVNGTIHSSEVRVDLDVPAPDYVFSPDYQLSTLEETAAYIEENHHLPEIPSAAEMEANGVELGEMNMLLLKKIEELTLHLIEKEELLEKVLMRTEQIENELKLIKQQL
ncbi:hypothetical protein [Reichenbachiella ulvae]|uniref:Uncharacterized protein n=1 Tax=Reichenbachiella ulvae TaxID=2980104 RepID=A0ABT3CUS1_9BACT|nr:hypothetical protein [Reichenbachiella ulvae]MCV9387445.1 hypothetical protein [Reichenbachiella ulvae]